MQTSHKLPKSLIYAANVKSAGGKYIYIQYISLLGDKCDIWMIVVKWRTSQYLLLLDTKLFYNIQVN